MKADLPECKVLGCTKHEAHKDNCPLTAEEVKLYLAHGYFGGESRASRGIVTGVDYWESPLRK